MITGESSMKNLTFVSALLLALASPVAPALAHGFGGGGWHGGRGFWRNGVWVPVAIGGVALGGAAVCMRWSDEFQQYVNVCGQGY
jgi:hypothetical protein